MAFTKAVRKRVYLKLALTGPSGSGKTWSGLALAGGLVGPEGRIAVIDTENGSASLYAGQFDFDSCELEPPFTKEKYIQAIRDAVAAGYEVLVIDSLSHAWAGDGGLLGQKEAKDQRGGNSFSNWADITKKQEAFKSAFLQAPIHVIVTMRSKQEYVLVDTDSKKAVPRKVGLAPIQRDGVEYEFTTVFDVAMNHEAETSKDRTGLFDGIVGKLHMGHGKMFREWLEGGAVAKAAPAAPADTPPSEDSERAQARLLNRARNAFFAECGRLDITIRNDEYGNPSEGKLLPLLQSVLCFPEMQDIRTLSAEEWDTATQYLEDWLERQSKQQMQQQQQQQATAQASPTAANAAATAAAATASPASVGTDIPDNESDPAPDDFDEFSDPFEEGAPPPSRPNPQQAPTPTSERMKANKCSVDGCPNVLSPSQLTISMNKFGKPVCMVHQKDAVPVGAGSGRSNRRPAGNASASAAETALL